jgi:thiol-disulfide isomerase/thioredoxin
MRPFLRFAAVLLLALGAASPILAADAGASRPVLAAESFDLSAHAGKVVVVDFWASWCKPCGKSLPWLSGLAKAHQADGLVVVAVNLDEKLNKAQAMLDGLDPAVIVVHDPKGVLAGKYELEGMPSAFVYDRKGELKHRHTGFLPAEAGAKEAEILDLLKEGGAPDAH